MFFCLCFTLNLNWRNCCSIPLCHVRVYLQSDMFVGQLLPHVITIHICTKGLSLDYHGVAEGLSKNRLGNAERLADGRGLFAQRDCHWITLRLRRDCQRIALRMLSDWRIAVGLPLDCLWIAFGFLDWTGLPLDCLWVCLGIGGRWGLPRGCLRFANGILWDYAGIPLGLAKYCQGVTSGLTRDCLICGPGFYQHRPDPLRSTKRIINILVRWFGEMF